MKWYWWLLSGLVAYEVGVQLSEQSERHTAYKMARAYCDALKKPLLRIGVRRSLLEPPNGDSTIDIDPAVLKIPGGVLGDERDMPFTDRQFGVCFNEHTLEHLRTAQDVSQAISECLRVADYTVLLCPSPYSLFGMFHHDHNLRLWFHQESKSITVMDNQFRFPMRLPHPGVVADLVLEHTIPSVAAPVQTRAMIVLTHDDRPIITGPTPWPGGAGRG